MTAISRVYMGYTVDSVIGRFAWSKAGRDEGRLFIITAVVDDNHVLLADGELRRVDNPKKKKLRHLEILSDRAEAVLAVLLSRRKPQDAELREAIRRRLEQDTQEPRDREG